MSGSSTDLLSEKSSWIGVVLIGFWSLITRASDLYA